MAKCKFPNGISVKPDGQIELDPCSYVTVEAYENVTIEIRMCKNCGYIDIAWRRQENTRKVGADE